MAIVVVGVLWQPTSTWAQVSEMVASKPWIRMRAGDQAGHKRELWMSIPRDIWANKSTDVVQFDNHRKGERFEFNTSTKKLLKLPVDNQRDSFESMASLFRAIFRGDSQLGERLAEDQIVQQKQRTVTEEGKSWLEHEFTIQRDTQSALCIVRVNPEQRLPVWLRFKFGEQQIQYDFDYPETGPASIFDLDVPRDVAVEDRMPPADLARILRTMASNQRGLDNYLAIVMRANRGPGGIQAPDRLVWRKGNKWRVELCFPSAPPKDGVPTEGNVAAWWRKRITELQTSPIFVCDGQKVYRADYSGNAVAWKVERTLKPGEGHDAAQQFGDASRNMIEFAAYPILMSSPVHTLSVDLKGTGGPEKSTLLEVSYTGNENRAFRKSRYWLDPERQYALVKQEFSDCPALENDPQVLPWQKANTHEYSGFKQSPQGIWYPTEETWKNATTAANPDTKEPAKPQDLVHQYYLDFEADLPDELFIPTMRPKAKE